MFTAQPKKMQFSCKRVKFSRTNLKPVRVFFFLLVFSTQAQSTPRQTHTRACARKHKQAQTHTAGPPSPQLNFKHSSHCISHGCHRARRVCIHPRVAFGGAESRARCDGPRLTVVEGTSSCLRTHTHTHGARAPERRREALISQREIYERRTIHHP